MIDEIHEIDELFSAMQRKWGDRGLRLLKVAIKRAMGTQFELLPAGFASFSLHPFTVSHALGCVLRSSCSALRSFILMN